MPAILARWEKYPLFSPSVTTHKLHIVNSLAGIPVAVESLTRRRVRRDMAKEDRGFASMDRAKQREIASKGGKAAHQKGTAHEWTSEEARDAGRKGGIASHQRRREQTGREWTTRRSRWIAAAGLGRGRDEMEYQRLQPSSRGCRASGTSKTPLDSASQRGSRAQRDASFFSFRLPAPRFPHSLKTSASPCNRTTAGLWSPIGQRLCKE